MSAPAPPTAPSSYAHLPVVQSSPERITVQELHAMMHANENDMEDKERDFIVVDVRRTDIDEPPLDFLIPNAINLPAQTFHQTLSGLVPMLSRYPKVIFHCSSSRGRGPRCAGWYQDALNTTGIIGSTSKAYVLEGGIKAWAEEFPEEVKRL